MYIEYHTMKSLHPKERPPLLSQAAPAVSTGCCADLMFCHLLLPSNYLIFIFLFLFTKYLINPFIQN